MYEHNKSPGRFEKISQMIGLSLTLRFVASIIVIFAAVIGLAIELPKLISAVDQDPRICRGNLLPQTCAPHGSSLYFLVDFNADYENSITLRRVSGGTERTFNNYYGKDAGRKWDQGKGSWTTEPNYSGSSVCYLIDHKFKRSRPNPDVNWTNNTAYEIGNSGNWVLFEDSSDRDHDDTTVTVEINYHASWIGRAWNYLIGRQSDQSCNE